MKNELHIHVDFDALFGNKLPDGFDLSEIGFHDEGNGLLTIDYYDIKKIKIIHDNARVKELNKEKLFHLLDTNLKVYYGDTLYRCFIADKLTIEEITDKHIMFDITNIKVVAKTYGQKFKDVFDCTIKEMLSA